MTGKVKELSSLIHFRPEAMLEHFLCLLELLVVFEHVQVGQDAHDSGEAVHLANVEELEDFHLEAEGGVRQEKDEVRHLGDVDHGVYVVVAFYQCHSTLLSCCKSENINDKNQVFIGSACTYDKSNGSLDGGDVLPSEILDERLEKGGLAHLGRSDDGDHDGRRLEGSPVHQRNMLLLGLQILSPVRVRRGSGSNRLSARFLFLS